MQDHAALPQGFRASGLYAGIKKKGRGSDLGLLVADEPTPAAAVFTNNVLVGAHVGICREHLARSGGLVRAVVVNSGCANCATGEEGLANARRTAEATAELLGCAPEQVLPMSTGAIGAQLPIERILDALPELVRSASSGGVHAFADAILTTDTRRKVRMQELVAHGSARAHVTGIAKGAGMVHPDMATMLSFLLTDAGLGDDPTSLLHALAARTYHRLTIDGDTSPNDTVLLWSSRPSKAPAPDALRPALERVAADLCRAIARDGEGATRLVTVEVRGARNEDEAARVGRVVATSPLTKTAIAGRDPNWGRILSAAGRAGIPFDAASARVWVGPSTVYDLGQPFPEREAEASRHLRDEEEVTIGIDLGVGDAGANVWTCDLTADYVRINADYRT
jgi:glutamate N-acetyltransferase/amino-acid N-acetyltransferase